jgi:hypothetical protein
MTRAASPARWSAATSYSNIPALQLTPGAYSTAGNGPAPRGTESTPVTTAPALRKVTYRTGTPSQWPALVTLRSSGPAGSGNWPDSELVVAGSVKDEGTAAEGAAACGVGAAIDDGADGGLAAPPPQAAGRESSATIAAVSTTTLSRARTVRVPALLAVSIMPDTFPVPATGTPQHPVRRKSFERGDAHRG